MGDEVFRSEPRKLRTELGDQGSPRTVDLDLTNVSVPPVLMAGEHDDVDQPATNVIWLRCVVFVFLLLLADGESDHDPTSWVLAFHSCNFSKIRDTLPSTDAQLPWGVTVIPRDVQSERDRLQRDRPCMDGYRLGEDGEDDGVETDAFTATGRRMGARNGWPDLDLHHPVELDADGVRRMTIGPGPHKEKMSGARRRETSGAAKTEALTARKCPGHCPEAVPHRSRTSRWRVSIVPHVQLPAELDRSHPLRTGTPLQLSKPSRNPRAVPIPLFPNLILTPLPPFSLGSSQSWAWIGSRLGERGGEGRKGGRKEGREFRSLGEPFQSTHPSISVNISHGVALSVTGVAGRGTMMTGWEKKNASEVRWDSSYLTPSVRGVAATPGTARTRMTCRSPKVPRRSMVWSDCVSHRSRSHCD